MIKFLAALTFLFFSWITAAVAVGTIHVAEELVWFWAVPLYILAGLFSLFALTGIGSFIAVILTPPE